MSNEQLNDAGRLTAAAEEVEAGRGPVVITRLGHKPVALVSAKEWQRPVRRSPALAGAPQGVP